MTEKRKGPPIKPDPNLEHNPVVLGSLEHTAIGLSKLPDGKFAVVTVKYNPVTGQAGTPELKLCDAGLSDAEYDFRDLVEDYLEDFNNKN